MYPDTNKQYLTNVVNAGYAAYKKADEIQKIKAEQSAPSAEIKNIASDINELHEKMNAFVNLISDQNYENIEKVMYQGIGCSLFPPMKNIKGKTTQTHLFENLGLYNQTKNKLLVECELEVYNNLDTLKSDIIAFLFLPSSMINNSLDSQILDCMQLQSDESRNAVFEKSSVN